MSRCTFILWPMLLCVLLSDFVTAQVKNSMPLKWTSDEQELMQLNGKWVTYFNGNVVIVTETGRIYCDSAIWLADSYANFKGHVVVDDAEYQLKADSVYYNIPEGEATARGSRVELWSYADSLFAVGVHAFYNRKARYFEMEERPVIYLKYPDTSRMVEIIADDVQYRAEHRRADASGNVIITSQAFSAEGPCAVMLIDEDILDLYDKPVVRRKQSELTGEFISIIFEGESLQRIDVIDSAYGEFIEPIDSAGIYFDRSVLAGSIITLNFVKGNPENVLCYDQAYSWYYPSMRGGNEYHENTVSGDTILFNMVENRLQSVLVTGGVIGVYLTGKLRDTTVVAIDDSSNTNLVVDSLADVAWGNLTEQTPTEDSVVIGTDSVSVLEMHSEEMTDSTELAVTGQPEDSVNVLPFISPADTLPLTNIDTVEYSGKFVEYSLVDSIIYLRQACEVRSGTMSLVAHDIRFDTHKRLVKAYSAEEVPEELDSIEVDELPSLAGELQPATIPVILRDGDSELYGNFLEYSIATEKGRIIQSKSEYEDGIYYGSKLLREQKHIFYVDDGYYTTCDAEEPHFHFKSSHMKLIEGDKMICRPVVFYLGRIPLIIIPYYVFPLKKGRHSGFLPFRFGNFERGDRYVNDVGYYWAASDYWDWRGAVDYHEKNRTITIKNRINFVKRYVLNGYINAEYRRKSSYSSSLAVEQEQRSYSVQGAYNHKITPSFEVKADGSYISSSSYYTEYSNNLDERLNREIRSKANFSKRFSKSMSLSGSCSHIVNLDRKTRSDQFPNMSLSLPPVWIFGSGSTDEDGQKVQKWYNGFIFRYKPSLNNFSSRVTLDSTISYISMVDTGAGELEEVTVIDTASYRSRKRYAKISHNPSLTLPTIKLIRYINIVPSFRYSETWFKIWDTDQSLNAGIDASTTYRTYSYSGGAGINTNLYGTIYPKIGSLIGLRHVLSPSVGWSWSPDIQKHPKIRSFAGGGAASSKRSAMSIGLKNIFQAKVKKGEKEANLELLALSSSFSYNFEAEEKPLSNMSTSFHTSSVPGVTIRGSMVHTFYDPETDEEKLFSPALLSFNFNINFRLAGKTFLFDDATGIIPHGEDSSSQVAASGGKRGWNLSVAYSFRESGLHTTSYRKSNIVSLTLGFNLTPTTTVSYQQQYDFERDLTVNNRVSIVRQLHCWVGSLYWVPIGSNRGFGFKLNVIDIPDIKIDNNHDTFQMSSFNRF